MQKIHHQAVKNDIHKENKVKVWMIRHLSPCFKMLGHQHKWKVNRKYVHFNGEILGLTDPSLTPDDSDNENRSNEVCIDVKYAKYKNYIYHYILLPDLKSGDLQIH